MPCSFCTPYCNQHCALSPFAPPYDTPVGAPPVSAAFKLAIDRSRCRPGQKTGPSGVTNSDVTATVHTLHRSSSSLFSFSLLRSLSLPSHLHSSPLLSCCSRSRFCFRSVLFPPHPSIYPLTVWSVVLWSEPDKDSGFLWFLKFFKHLISAMGERRAYVLFITCGCGAMVSCPASGIRCRLFKCSPNRSSFFYFAHSLWLKFSKPFSSFPPGWIFFRARPGKGGNDVRITLMHGP